MAIVVGDTSGLAQGISTAGAAIGQGLATGLEARAKNRLLQQQRTALDQALSQADLSTQQGQQDFVRKYTSAGGDVKDALGILDRAMKMNSDPFVIDDPRELGELFRRLGVQPQLADDYADLYVNLSQGGKTAFANMFVENLQRGRGAQIDAQQMNDIAALDDDIEEISRQPEKAGFEKLDLFEGLTPKEKVARQRELRNENAKEFVELKQKRKSLRDEKTRIRQLEAYNESGKLPKGMAKLNIDWKTGDIRVPALANAETQGFVKTVNDFTVKAKDTFGSRVTNFELGAFMKRLPTLANSEEGRRLIIAQMDAMADLDQLYYDSLKEVYDHYKLDGIDSQEAERIAEERRAPKEEELKKRVQDATMAQEVFELKAGLPAGVVLMEYNGKKVGVPEDQIEAGLAKGARLL